MKQNLPLDANGVPFTKPAFWLHPMEYRKICSEINQGFDVHHKGERICTHTSFGIDGKVYVYWFENHGFDNYNIYLRVLDVH